MTFLKYFMLPLAVALIVSASWMISTLNPPLIKLKASNWPAPGLALGDVTGSVPTPLPAAAKTPAYEECGE